MASYEIVLAALRELSSGLDQGARMPTIRQLMQRYRVGQATVQQAFGEMRRAGLLDSQVGRGTYLVKAPPGAKLPPSAPGARPLSSLLMLSSSHMNERCMLVQNQIVANITGEGAKVVQISYHDADHLMQVLRSVPRFDAAILQSHYEIVAVRLLAMLMEKTDAVVVDGHSLAGTDIDRVGTDWEEPLEQALEHLTGLGHRRIGLLTLDSAAQPVLAVRRAFARLSNWRGTDLQPVAPVVLAGVHHPTQQIGAVLAATLRALMAERGGLPFTALLTLGISDGAGMLQALRELELDGPDGPSVHVLGHHDVSSEHFGTFTISGSSHVDAAAALLDAIRRRIEAPGVAPHDTFLRCRSEFRGSTRPAAIA